jgi:glycosyltransferase involved in cell wall biosynthesis
MLQVLKSGERSVGRPVEISVVSPVYKCGNCVAEMHRQLIAVLEPLVSSFEIVLVNDGCPDNSWDDILAVAAQDVRVKAIDLSRNFGQHYAIAAGVHYSSGNWVVVMDCDLQDRPAEIPRLYRKALEGYDIVYALRSERHDPWIKRTLSRAFSVVYNLLSEVKLDTRACNFSIASRQVIDGYCRLKELNRSYHLLLRWLGFHSTYLVVEHADRFAGKSAYNWRRGFLLAVESITSQSNKPLVMAIKTGFLMAGSAMAAGAIFVIRYFTLGVGVAGWTSVIVSIYFIGGLLLANLGVIGLYLGKVFNEVKVRPLYMVKEEVNFDEAETPASFLRNDERGLGNRQIVSSGTGHVRLPV